jgi:hypothetical protein
MLRGAVVAWPVGCSALFGLVQCDLTLGLFCLLFHHFLSLAATGLWSGGAHIGGQAQECASRLLDFLELLLAAIIQLAAANDDSVKSSCIPGCLL